MASTTTLWTMRHGPTTWNVEKRIQGNVETEIRLDKIEAYFEQIAATNLPQPDIIIVTGLSRTEQTAKALMKYRDWIDIPIHKDPRLNERKWGIFEGVLIDEARKRFETDPEIRKEFPDVTDWDEPDFKVSGGESIAEVGQRIKPAFADIAKQFNGKNILTILHAGVLVALGLEFTKITECFLTQIGEVKVKV